MKALDSDLLGSHMNTVALRYVVRERLGLKPIGRRSGGPRVERVAEIAIIYWKLFRLIDWNGEALKARAS